MKTKKTDSFEFGIYLKEILGNYKVFPLIAESDQKEKFIIYRITQITRQSVKYSNSDIIEFELTIVGNSYSETISDCIDIRNLLIQDGAKFISYSENYEEPHYTRTLTFTKLWES